MKIGVIGSGAMGLALSTVLVENGHKVRIFAINPAELHSINEKHSNERALGDIKLSENIVAYDNIKDTIFDAEAILFATPSAFAYDAILNVNKVLDHKALIINATKGLDLERNLTMQELLSKYLSKDKVLGIASILGPGFAREICLKNLTAVCSASKDLEIAKTVQNLFSNNYFRVYAMTDVIGAEIGTSLKNALAIGSGIVKGLGFGENTKSALITRGLAEITRFGVALGANPETFLGLTGVGDLVLTCNTTESRNYTAGLEIGRTNDAETFLKNNTATVEGVGAIRAAYEIAKKRNINMPIINALFEVMFEGKKPSVVVDKLMVRPLTNEK